MKRPASVMEGLQAPISARIRMRRSTALIVVLFLGFGALWLSVKTNSSTAATNTDKAFNQVLNGLKPNESFTIIRTPTTTSRPVATVPTPGASSTTVGPTPTTGSASLTTTTTRATTTTSPGGRSTTTTPTTTASVGGGSTTTPGPGG